jgi:low temperature requirement protein LtrA
MVFFAIWWAWMNFTWYASAYDVDDGPYRLATGVEIAGVLVLAAGVPRAFDGGDFTVVTAGYVIMRLALVGQWLRAAHADRAGRRTALRFAAGVTACQLGWIGLLFLPEPWGLRLFPVLVLAELAVPLWAERAGRTAWHPGHIAERYGLFTLIVLGETVLAATTAIQVAVDTGGATVALLTIAGSGLVIVFSMWWLYFDRPVHHLLVSNRVAFVWGYGHYFVFSSAAAVGAGLAVAVDGVDVPAAVSLPVAVYLIVVWALHIRPHRHHRTAKAVAFPVAAALVLATLLTPWPLPLTALVLAAMVAFSSVEAARA